LSRRRPQFEIGRACNQSPACGAETARSLARWWLSSALDKTAALSAAMNGASQDFCFDAKRELGHGRLCVVFFIIFIFLFFKFFKFF
jgi:hypothetical protein